MTRANSIDRTLRFYWTTSFVLVLINLYPLTQWRAVAVPAAAFELAVYLTYAVQYLILPMIIVTVLRRFNVLGAPVILGIAVAGCGIVQVLLFMDRTVFEMFGFHLNGFVWNLVTTRGGIASLGADAWTQLTYGVIAAGLVTMQWLAMILARRAAA